MPIKINPEIVSIERKFQGMCKRPYRKHPQGCPNFGKRKTCPPNLPLINEIFDFNKELYLIYTEFNVGEYAEKMRQRPKLKTPGQWYNSRYWQPVARKEHRLELEDFLEMNPGFVVNKSPEAHGVNVTELMKSVDIELRWGVWPPEHDLENKTYIVSLAGYKK